jgi:hypothetical protein
MIDDVKLADPRVRMFLDKSKDWADYDVDDPRLPLVDKTITLTSKKVIKIKETKKKRR